MNTGGHPSTAIWKRKYLLLENRGHGIQHRATIQNLERVGGLINVHFNPDTQQLMSSYCDIHSLAVIDQRTLWDHSSQLESEKPREDSGEAKLHSDGTI